MCVCVSAVNSSADAKSTGKPLLSLNPPEEVVFNQNVQGDLMAVVAATNISSGPVALKVQ